MKIIKQSGKQKYQVIVGDFDTHKPFAVYKVLGEFLSFDDALNFKLSGEFENTQDKLEGIETR